MDASKLQAVIDGRGLTFKTIALGINDGVASTKIKAKIITIARSWLAGIQQYRRRYPGALATILKSHCGAKANDKDEGEIIDLSI